ncbi:hypothetical protein E4K10_22075 [Streptomyces sp. T1317-0309]|nr:hypothetical protein E4K10_22075 [Streptomyces sp. T1317-0309]
MRRPTGAPSPLVHIGGPTGSSTVSAAPSASRHRFQATAGCHGRGTREHAGRGQHHQYFRGTSGGGWAYLAGDGLPAGPHGCGDIPEIPRVAKAWGNARRAVNFAVPGCRTSGPVRQQGAGPIRAAVVERAGSVGPAGGREAGRQPWTRL